MPTELDRQISSAVKRLTAEPGEKTFDYAAYIQAFHGSALKKAQAVLEILRQEQSPVGGLVPVFVSIGGGDGTEAVHLLENSAARHAILVEGARPLAEAARKTAASLNQNRILEVFEGDAAQQVDGAIASAQDYVRKGQADFVAVTCHAVLHELFDRSEHDFDPLQFFSRIFGHDDISTWFSYREPGIPEKWPNAVLLAAKCTPQSLLELAELIRSRHRDLRELQPKPHVAGDHLRLHKTLAMELLAKMFYLPDLHHEIEERSTAVDHGLLTNSLWLAIGKTANKEGRANIRTLSSPTDSFVELWDEFGVEVIGLGQDNSQLQLSIAESQTRVVAWRLKPSSQQSVTPAAAESSRADLVQSELHIAQSALDTGETALLETVIVSRARTWIESRRSRDALRFLAATMATHDANSMVGLWSNYVIAIAKLFARETIDPQWFSEVLETAASNHGISVLYRAERMEFYRATAKWDDAIRIANRLLEDAQTISPENNSTSDVIRYAQGVSFFLIGNLLRQGGQYSEAWKYVDAGQRQFKAGLPSHDTELAHCYYAKAVCTAITGLSEFDTPFPEDANESTRLFAAALIVLTYSHAAWFLDDIREARQYALRAAEIFSSIGLTSYANRATRVAALLSWWRARNVSPDQVPDQQLAKLVTIFQGRDEDVPWLQHTFPFLRSSLAAGLLQFARQNENLYNARFEVTLPRLLGWDQRGFLEWRTGITVGSLREADELLREHLGVPIERRIPLLAD